MTRRWPVELRGITETVVTTRQPDGRWNAAALGLAAGDPVTATTWGETRTRRNFDRDAAGYAQFVNDPVTFVEAALGIHEADDPILPAADAWARVEVERLGADTVNGTRTVEWALRPTESGVERRVVPTVNRGFNAVVEATVVASRLGVSAYDDDGLRRRLEALREVARRCGGDREVAALARLDALVG